MRTKFTLLMAHTSVKIYALSCTEITQLSLRSCIDHNRWVVWRTKSRPWKSPGTAGSDWEYHLWWPQGFISCEASLS